MRTLMILLALALSAVAVAEEVEFTAIDVYVQTDEPLAAWQFLLQERNGAMQVVGVENGESPAYTRAPYYDREAVNLGTADRIIVADYSLAKTADLPRGRVRIATLHLMLKSDLQPDFDISLVAAARPDGQHLDATISVEPTARKKP